MKKRLTLYIPAFMSLVVILLSCQLPGPGAGTMEGTPEPVTPVTVTTIASGPMEEFVELNASSVFQQRWIVKSNLTGYLQKSGIILNKFVNKGQLLFTLKTREAASIGNSINMLDSSFRFSGINNIRANGSGFVSEINHQEGDYIQEGEQLAVITDTKSFVFLLDLPYEMRPYIIGKNSVQVLLPDGEKLDAFISGNMPSMDSISQTQRIILKVNATHAIPENLIAKVKLIKNSNNHAVYLPKASILADEAQSEFWIMKLLNDSTAIKVQIKKGIETNDEVEIISPALLAQDKILITGNYGLGDTAKVKVLIK